MTFSQEQKDIMIEFYNRQANYGVRAKPQDVIKEMQERGVDVLKESQIKSWWSSYHQKRKKEMQQMAEVIENHLQGQLRSQSAFPSSSADAHPTANAHSQDLSSSQSSQAAVPHTLSATGSYTPSSHTIATNPATAHSATVTCNAISTTTAMSATPNRSPSVLQHLSTTTSSSSNTAAVTSSSNATPACEAAGSVTTTRATTRSSSPLTGKLTAHGVVEWYLPLNICQSLLDGRNGSDVCILIMMVFGLLYQRDGLSMPSTGNMLPSVWKTTMVEDS